MKNITIALVIAILATAFIGTIITSAYTYSLSVELAEVKRSAYNEAVSLSTRFRNLKKELNAEINDRLEAVETAADTLPSESSAPETAPETEMETLPILMEPETTPAATTPSFSLYVIAEHEGIIGIFDAAGELMQTVNVLVMTLPEADREALAMGMAVYSWEEAVELAECFE